MVEVAGRPILWHVMKMYARHGFRDFVICGERVNEAEAATYWIRHCGAVRIRAGFGGPV